MVRARSMHPGNGTPRVAPTGTRPLLGRAKTDRTLHELLDRIGDGTIGEIGDLEEEEVLLLRAYYGAGEDLQILLDRMRGSGRVER